MYLCIMSKAPMTSRPTFIFHTLNGEISPDERAACSFGIRKGVDKINKGPTNWFLFDREKPAYKSGAVTGAEERYDCALRQLAFDRRRRPRSDGWRALKKVKWRYA
jgi:hypothetical protein